MLTRCVKVAVSFLLYSCDKLGTVILKIAGKPFSGTCVVLYYHDVPIDERNAFRRQMEFLVKKTTPISIETTQTFENNKSYSAVTFDDGFANVFYNALPVLKGLKIPAAVFIPTAHIGRRPEWIRDKNSEAYGYFIADGSMIKKWQDDITFGSHTVTHPDLTKLPSGKALSELTDSKAHLEELTGKKVTFLSFPHGCYNNTLIEFAKSAGYSKVFTINPDPCVADFSRRIIGRVMVTPSDWKIEFLLAISGSYRWMRLASKLKNIIIRIVLKEKIHE